MNEARNRVEKARMQARLNASAPMTPHPNPRQRSRRDTRLLNQAVSWIALVANAILIIALSAATLCRRSRIPGVSSVNINNCHMEVIRMKRITSLLFVVLLGLSPLATLAAPVNINTADAKVIDAALVGVGAKTAKSIVDYRTRHGEYKSIDDLLKVKGIGPALLEKNRANLTVK